MADHATRYSILSNSGFDEALAVLRSINTRPRHKNVIVDGYVCSAISVWTHHTLQRNTIAEHIIVEFHEKATIVHDSDVAEIESSTVANVCQVCIKRVTHTLHFAS